MTQELVPLDGVSYPVAEIRCASDLEQALTWRGNAAAFGDLLKRRKIGLDMANRINEARVRVERMIGAYLVQTVRAGNPQLRRDETIGAARLPEGMSRSQASRFRKLARLPDDVFERHILLVKNEQEEITTAGLIGLHDRMFGSRRSSAWKVANNDDRPPRMAALLEDSGDKTFPCIVINGPAPLKQLAALPVEALADPRGCHVYLWTIPSSLKESLELLEQWGFLYRWQFIWCRSRPRDKQTCFRTCHEILLLGVQGNLPFAARGERSWQHWDDPAVAGAKPEQARAMIERCSPAPRLELLASSRAAGWISWNSELETT